MDASEVDLTIPVMSLRAWDFITSNLLKVAGVVVISASQPHCRVGVIYTSYVGFSMDLELPHLLPASLLRTFHFPLLFSTVFCTRILYVCFSVKIHS